MRINRSILKPILFALASLAIAPRGEAAIRSGFPLMMEITDPRLLALGGAALTEYERIGSISQNPACAFGSSGLASANYARLPVDVWSGRLLAGSQINSYYAGIYLQTYGYGTFEESVPGTGLTGRTFEAAEHLVGGFISGDFFGKVTWGVGAKIDWWKIDDKGASAGALDAGLTYDPGWEKVKLGLALRNWGSQWSGDDVSRTPTPFEATIAASKRLEHLPLKLFGAVHMRRTGEGEFNADFLAGNPGVAFGAGGEFEITPKGGERPLNLRIGYRSIGQGFRVGNSRDAMAGFSFGLGIQARRMMIDYAFAPFGALGNVHRVGVATAFRKK